MDLKAYELYTRAKAIDPWDTPGGAVPNLKQKVSLLSEAVQRDPAFALAYCELAEAHFDIEDVNRDGSHLVLGKAAVETALQLRPGLGLAYRELARYSLFTSDYEHGSEDAAIALRSLPNDAQAFRVAARIACYMNRWEQGRAWMEKAFSLDPLDVEIEYDLFDIYQAMRLYPQWTRVLAAHRTFDPLDGGWTDMQRAKLKLDVGDVKAARDFLARVPPDFNETQEIWEIRFTADLYARDYDAAEKLIVSTPDEWTDRVYFGTPPLTWANGMLARLRGDEPKARTVFAAARQWTTTRRNEETRERLHFRLISLCDAVLGRKEDAIREARQVCEEWPMTRDARIAPSYLENLALVYALAGEREQALDQLEALSRMYDSITYGELRCSPYWDSLRGDPRFEAVVISLTPKLGH